MDKVLIPLDLFYKMIEAIDDGDLRQQAYNAQENVYTSDLEWISDSLRNRATRCPRVADYLERLATKIEKSL